MKLPLLPRWKKHKPAVATHTPAVKKATQAKKKKAGIPVHLGAHASATSAAAHLAVREKEAVERKQRATEAEAEIDLSAVLPVPDTARAAHHHDCNDRDTWLAEHAYLVRLRAAATASVASPTHHGSDACTTTTNTTITTMSRSSRRRLIDDAPAY